MITGPRYTVAIARRLRAEMTPAERTIWAVLRKRQINGLRFRRQFPIGRYIVDFYCHELKLIIEIDGEIHDRQKEYDRNRDEYLSGGEYTILRFTNDDVCNHIEKVIAQIRSFSAP